MSNTLPTEFDFHPLVGWKTWTLRNGYLITAGGVAWTPRHPFRCYCTGALGHDAPPPASRCSCGVYSYKALPDLIEYAQHSYGDFILGQIWSWGRVIEHKLGYRAEFAYPKALAAPHASLAAELAKRYGVECEVMDIAKVFQEKVREKA